MAELTSSDAAENAFYTAFENRDLESMMAIWAETDSVVCIHPQGPQIMGFEPVCESFREIMNNSPQFSINVDVLEEFTNNELSIRYVNERISTQDGSRQFTVLATNAYALTKDGWKMVLHHASPGSRPKSKSSSHHESKTDTFH